MLLTEDELRPLLAQLSAAPPAGGWNGWRWQRVANAGNNLIYRVAGAAGEIAVKWTIRDEPDRAGREFDALLVLADLAPGAAPLPLLLDRETYQQPVIVQSWLDGAAADEIPADDGAWRGLLAYLARVHSIAPGQAELRPAVLGMSSAAQGIERVREPIGKIPAAERPAGLAALVSKAVWKKWPQWEAPRLGLCRSDPNILNFLRVGDGWASVDWENSGWSDPAFEVADLLTHPRYEDVDADRRAWIVQTYAELCGEAEIGLRIGVYYRLMLVWWAARLARSLYEWPRGLDARLVERRADWLADLSSKYERYRERAGAMLEAPPDCW